MTKQNCMEDNFEKFIRENKRITFENKLSNSYSVSIDAEKFKRVLQNIMDNAKRSIEKQTGQLKIMLRETNSSLIIKKSIHSKR